MPKVAGLISLVNPGVKVEKLKANNGLILIRDVVNW